MKSAIAAAATTIALSSAEYSISDFRTKLFWKRPHQGYYDVDVGLPATDSGARVMSIGDLNNDKMNDLVMADADGQTLTVYYFDDSSGMFTYAAPLTLPSGYVVDNVFPTNSPTALQGLIIVASNSDGTSTKLFYYA